MWDSYGAGSNAVIFWLWHPRDIGTEGGEWGLVGSDASPNARLTAVKSVADILKKNSSLAKAHTQPARVAILFNRQAAVVNNIDGRKQDRQEEVEEALFGCYLALLRAHIPTQFVDIDQLKKGEVTRFPVLYAPDSYAIDDQGLEALKDYVKQGGTLWADGLLAWKTETTQVRPTVPGGLTDLVGAEADEIYPIQASRPYSVTSQNELGGELWKLPLQLKGAEVVLRDSDGNPFAVKNRFGKGEVYYFSSALSLAYARRGDPLVQQWIIEPAVAQVDKMPVRLKNASNKVILRGLIGADASFAILSNWGETQTVTVSFDGVHQVINADTGNTVPVTIESGRTIANVSLNAGSSLLLVAR